MLTLTLINPALQHRISDGTEYMWSCYGSSARYLNYESEYGHASVIFDTKDQTIYEAEVEMSNSEMRPYRWLNPAYAGKMHAEAVFRGVDDRFAWDDVKWIDLDVADDWLNKATAIFNGEPFDSRVQIEIELSDQEFIMLSKLAHEADITLNEMVERALFKAIDLLKGTE
jgi:hypothetical protein